MAALYSAADILLDTFSGSSCLLLLRLGYSSCNPPPLRLLSHLLTTLESAKLAHGEVARAMWLLHSCSIRPGPQLLLRWFKLTQAVATGYHPGQLLTVLWCCCHWQVLPPAEWMDAMLTGLLAPGKLQGCSAATLAGLVSVLVQLGVRPEYELVQAITDASFVQLYNMGLDELLATSLGVASWRVGFSAEWVLTLQQRLLLLLPEADALQVAAVAVVAVSGTAGVSAGAQEQLQLVQEGAAAVVMAALERSEGIMMRALTGAGMPAGGFQEQSQDEAVRDAKEMLSALLYVLSHGSGELLPEAAVTFSWMEAMWQLVVTAAERAWLETWEVLMVFLWLDSKGAVPHGQGVEVVMKQGYRATAAGAPAIVQEGLLAIAEGLQEEGVLELPAKTRRIWERDVEEARHWEQKLHALIKARQEGRVGSGLATSGILNVELEGVWAEAERLGQLEELLEHPLQSLARMKMLRLVDGLHKAQWIVQTVAHF